MIWAIIPAKLFDNRFNRAITKFPAEHTRHRAKGAVKRTSAGGLHHHCLLTANHAVRRSISQAEIRHGQSIQVGHPGPRRVVLNNSVALLPGQIRDDSVTGIGPIQVSLFPNIQESVHGRFALAAHDQRRMLQRLFREERDMRSAKNHGYVPGTAFARDGVTSLDRRSDGRDADHFRTAVFLHPRLQIELLSSLHENAAAPRGATVHQAGKDEAAQARQRELGENVESSPGRFDEQH